jgi:dihydrofolate reductase
MIVARAQNGVIGRDGDLPWRLPSDLKFFKKTTLGKPCLMGRKTWESLPFPLPGRANMVLTRQTGYTPKGAEVFHDFNDMLGEAHAEAGRAGVDEIMIIGGGGLYAQALPLTHRIYMTVVEADVAGDTSFADLGPEWTLTSEGESQQGERDQYPFRICIYERR